MSRRSGNKKESIFRIHKWFTITFSTIGFAFLGCFFTVFGTGGFTEWDGETGSETEVMTIEEFYQEEESEDENNHLLPYNLGTVSSGIAGEDAETDLPEEQRGLQAADLQYLSGNVYTIDVTNVFTPPAGAGYAVVNNEIMFGAEAEGNTYILSGSTGAGMGNGTQYTFTVDDGITDLTLVLNGLHIRVAEGENRAPVKVGESTSVIIEIASGSENTLEYTADKEPLNLNAEKIQDFHAPEKGRPGIEIAETANLHITGQDNSGKLTVQGGWHASGIGTYESDFSGELLISGGILDIYGGPGYIYNQYADEMTLGWTVIGNYQREVYELVRDYDKYYIYEDGPSGVGIGAENNLFGKILIYGGTVTANSGIIHISPRNMYGLAEDITIEDIEKLQENTGHRGEYQAFLEDIMREHRRASLFFNYIGRGAAIGTGNEGDIERNAVIQIMGNTEVVVNRTISEAGIGTGRGGNLKGSIEIGNSGEANDIKIPNVIVNGIPQESISKVYKVFYNAVLVADKIGGQYWYNADHGAYGQEHSQYSGAGIGTGMEGSMEDEAKIYIYGGNITIGNTEINDYIKGPGIGSGYRGDFNGNIVIDDGEIEISGIVHGAGIGSGAANTDNMDMQKNEGHYNNFFSDKGGYNNGHEWCGNITINGGNININIFSFDEEYLTPHMKFKADDIAGRGAAIGTGGIGSNRVVRSARNNYQYETLDGGIEIKGNITINGGTIRANGGASGGAVIGTGYIHNNNEAAYMRFRMEIEVNGGDLFLDNSSSLRTLYCVRDNDFGTALGATILEDEIEAVPGTDMGLFIDLNGGNLEIAGGAYGAVGLGRTQPRMDMTCELNISDEVNMKACSPYIANMSTASGLKLKTAVRSAVKVIDFDTDQSFISAIFGDYYDMGEQWSYPGAGYNVTARENAMQAEGLVVGPMEIFVYKWDGATEKLYTTIELDMYDTTFWMHAFALTLDSADQIKMYARKEDGTVWPVLMYILGDNNELLGTRHAINTSETGSEPLYLTLGTPETELPEPGTDPIQVHYYIAEDETTDRFVYTHSDVEAEIGDIYELEFNQEINEGYYVPWYYVYEEDPSQEKYYFADEGDLSSIDIQKSGDIKVYLVSSIIDIEIPAKGFFWYANQSTEGTSIGGTEYGIQSAEYGVINHHGLLPLKVTLDGYEAESGNLNQIGNDLITGKGDLIELNLYSSLDPDGNDNIGQNLLGGSNAYKGTYSSSLAAEDTWKFYFSGAYRPSDNQLPDESKTSNYRMNLIFTLDLGGDADE